MGIIDAVFQATQSAGDYCEMIETLESGMHPMMHAQFKSLQESMLRSNEEWELNSILVSDRPDYEGTAREIIMATSLTELVRIQSNCYWL